MRRALAISALPGIAGGEQTLLRALPRLWTRGFAPRLAVPAGGALRDAARAAGLPVTRLPLGPPERRTAASYAGAVLAALPAVRSDVVLLNGLSTQRTVPALRVVGRPAVLRVNNPLHGRPAAWGRRGFWDVVRVVVCDSAFTARECAAAGAPPERVEVAFPPAWGETAPPAADTDGGGAVGFVGQIEPRKGVAELVESAEEFLAGRPRASLTIVGAAPDGQREYERHVRDLASRSPAADRIRLEGFASDAADRMSRFDLLVVPSKAEPYGTVAAEAAAAGIPVVATRVGGLEEVVLDGHSGVLVPPGDPRSLAGAVSALLDDAERRSALGRTARRESRRFDPDVYADRLAELLQRALVSARRR